MTNRTVKLLGWGVGTAEITALLDGITVFSGSVELVERTQDNEGEQTAPTLFSFEVPIEFVGTKHMIISVADNPVTFGQIVANHSCLELGAVSYSTGPDDYIDVADFDSSGIKDPRSNVYIDKIKQETNRLLGTGTWHWTVNPGSTIEHDLSITIPGLLDD
jgi:DNA polymerase III epsilon subunit-like protein